MKAIPIERARSSNKRTPVDDLQTDKANGERFAYDHAASLRYLTDRQIWIRWDEKRWRPATDGELFRAAKLVAQGIIDDGQRQTDEDIRKRRIKWGLDSYSVTRIRAMITMAATELTCELRSGELDQHRHLLTAANGVIDLQSGRLCDHDRRHFLTKLVDIAYDYSATCDRWLKFLDEIFDGRAELIAYVRRAIGYSLSGFTREHVFFFAHGGGCNGKSLLVRILMRLCGDAAVSTSFSTLTADRSAQGGATPELADLHSARLVVSGEADEGVRLSEGLVKLLTGDDPITCRRLYEAPFTFTPQFKLWLAANHKPVIKGTDDGIWRRPRLLPFDVSFKGREDKQLAQKLDAELPGILRWAVAGAVEWFEHGLGEAPEVTAATAEYRTESDVIGQFLGDEFELHRDAFTPTDEIYAAYSKWCEQVGLDPLKKPTLTKRITARGLRADRQCDQRGIAGLQRKKGQ